MQPYLSTGQARGNADEELVGLAGAVAAFPRPRSCAREWEESGRLWFEVPMAVPLVGRIVHYIGWLEPTNVTNGAANLTA